MAEGKPNTALGSGGAGSSSSSFTLPGLGSDGFNDPIFMPMPSSKVGTHVDAAESEEGTPPTSAESTPHGTPSKPPKGRAAPSPSATGRAGAASGQGQADELEEVAAKARRREFYSRTAKGFIIPREDIPDTPKEKGESNRKHVSKAIEEGIRAEYKPSRPSAVACGEKHPETPEGGAGEECCTVQSTARSRIKDEEDEDESADNKFGLYLRVSSSDIRQDETGPPYQVYVVDVWHGRKTWSLERPLGAFYALGERLQGKVSPDVLPPSLPQRPAGGGWLKGLSMAGETKEDRIETTKLLDSYVSSLAGLTRRLEREVSVGAADAESLMHLVHCLYEFVDFVEASGSYRSRLKLSDSTAAPSQESSQSEEIKMPGAIQLEAGEDAEIETMLSLSLELQRLQEMLKEVEEKGRQEAKVKRDMGGAVVGLTEELKELQASERLLKGRVDEAIRGPHRNEGDAEILSSLRQRLWRARASRLYEVLAPGCSGGESGADASGYNDPMPIGAKDRAGGGDIDGVDAEETSPGSRGQGRAVEGEMGALEEEAVRLFSPPLDGGRGKDKLLSVQGALIAAENVKLWGSLVGLASSWIKVFEFFPPFFFLAALRWWGKSPCLCADAWRLVIVVGCSWLSRQRAESPHSTVSFNLFCDLTQGGR